jgi:hypothetical protein
MSWRLQVPISVCLGYTHTNQLGTETGEIRHYSDGLRAGRTGFDSRHKLEFCFLHSIQTGPGTHRTAD